MIQKLRNTRNSSFNDVSVSNQYMYIMYLCLELFREFVMPQWYYEKKELKNTPSYVGGMDNDTETRYRREGAR